MKLMKHITIALVLCAIPAMALGQVAECENCEHQLPVYNGAAGFVATADGVEMVNYRSTCDGVYRTGQLEADDDGLVSLLLRDDLACDAMDGKFELGPIMDGGWFWMHIGANSAVGNIVAMDVLDNTPTEITNAGESITMMPGAGVVLLTHPESGRVGLLPTILPVPEVDPVPPHTCSFTVAGAVQTAETMNCMLGDGGTGLQVRGSVDPFTGMRAVLDDGVNVARPIAAGSTITLEVDLWGNDTGHFSAENPDLGHGPDGDALAATITATLPAIGPGQAAPELSTAGLVFAQDGTTNVGTLTISPEATYCDPSATPPVNHTAKITFNAAVDATQAGQVTPAIGDTTDGTASVATHVINLVCPTASSSQQGVELVPDNLFPTE